MCGIVAYIGGQNATPIILDGLKKLEYRGYDSAGIAVLQDGKIEIRRDVGKNLPSGSADCSGTTRRQAWHRPHALGNTRCT